MVEIHTTTKWKPSIADARLSSITSTILGKKYDLTINFVGTTRAQKLNIMYRKKTYVPNILSFPLSDTDGEIYICPAVAQKEASSHGFSYTDYIQYLVIHGCVHLKGHDHGDAMDTLEEKFLKKFNIQRNV